MFTPQVRKCETNLGCCHVLGTDVPIMKMNLTLALFLLSGVVVLTLL